MARPKVLSYTPVGLQWRDYSRDLLPAKWGQRWPKNAISALPPKADVSRPVCEGVAQRRAERSRRPIGSPRRFSGAALRSVRWGEVLSNVVGDEKWQIVHGWLRDRLED
jgi:hypothetical protein